MSIHQAVNKKPLNNRPMQKNESGMNIAICPLYLVLSLYLESLDELR